MMRKTDSAAEICEAQQNDQASRAMDDSATEAPDVESIMARIRTQVKRSLKEHPPRSPKYTPPAAELFTGSVSPVLYSDELNYLNAHWNDWSVAEEFTSHRPYLGPLIVKVKNLVRRFLLDSVFKTYFEREREFQMQLVRHLNALARYVDQRDSELFWQIVNKVDSDVKALNDRVDLFFNQASNATSRVEFNCRQGSEHVQQSVEKLSRSLDDLRREPGIKRTLLPGYAAKFFGVSGVVVDLCCFDPRFLISLRALGISGFGVTPTRRAHDSCQALSVESVVSKPLDYLLGVHDGTLGGIFAERLITSQDERQLKEILATAVNKVMPGGRIVLVENRRTLLSENRSGKGAEVIEGLLENLGVSSEVLGNGQSDESLDEFEKIELPSYAPPHLYELVERINFNISKLNQVFFEQEELCIIGRIPN
jgi:hypothetical protein